MAALLVASIFAVLSLGYCHKNYTVTEECFFDIEVKNYERPGDDFRGRFVVGLFGETAPMASMNFAQITKGFKRGRDNLTYKHSKVHRVIKDFLIQLGDITKGDGSGGKSIYGEKFIDENFYLSHRAPGMVAMANHGPDTNGSQFFILLTKSRWLDGKHVVFGKIVKGMDVVKAIGDVPTDPGTASPKRAVTIIDCGIVGLNEKYELSDEQLDSDADVHD